MPWGTRPLDRNKVCQRPSRFVFVDTETWTDKLPTIDGQSRHTLRLGVACSVTWPQGESRSEEWIEFTDSDVFWKWLRGRQRKGKVVWVVAHNMVYDFTILSGWDRLETTEYRVKTEARDYFDCRTGEPRRAKEWQGLVAIDGLPFHLETQGEVGRVNFTDLMNYHRCPLAAVAKTLGTEKLPRPDAKMPDEWWFAYCRRDVEILKDAYLSLVDRWCYRDLGNWAMSGPALAWNHYRHRHMPKPVTLHGHSEARDLEWAACHPGEIRAWFRGHCPGPVVHYDVNSLYPSVMAGREFPTELVDYIVNPQPGMAEWLMGKFLTIGEVDVETHRGEIPFRRAGRTLYPVGRFRTTLAGPELIRAWYRREVRRITKLAYYRGAGLFDSFVGEWWERKRQALDNRDIAGEKFAKLMLNSLPGKFSQRNPSWRFDARIPVVRPWRAFPWREDETGVVWNARAIGWQGQYAAARDDSAHAFPAISAYVTSYAREKMRAIRADVPPSCLFYQDTDSLMVATDDYATNEYLAGLVGTELGDLREVGRYEKVTIRGPKNYSHDGEHTIAGVKISDDECGPMLWTGTRWEGGGQIVTRPPDGTVRTWPVDFDTPGSCLEGGYGQDGWSYPVQIP
jgi:hypothetical protein